MKGGRWAIFGISITGVVLAGTVDFLGKYVPAVAQLNESQQLRIEFLILTCTLLIVLNLLFALTISQTESAVSAIEDVKDGLLNGLNSLEGRISLLTSESLYRELKVSARKAKSRVYTSYLGQIPATRSPVASKRQYFDTVSALPKQRPDVTIRRIILYSDENMAWVRDLVKAYAGCANASIAVYCPEPSAALPLSISLFDASRSFIVHAADRPPGTPRDIVIVSRKVTGLLDAYYDSVWQKSVLVLNSGTEIAAALDSISTSRAG